MIWVTINLVKHAKCSDTTFLLQIAYNKIITKLGKIQAIFMVEDAAPDARGVGKRSGKCLERPFCNYLVRYLDLLIKQKVSVWITTVIESLKDLIPNFSSEFTDSILLPKLYSLLRAKTSGLN